MIPPPPLQKRAHKNLERAFETLSHHLNMRQRRIGPTGKIQVVGLQVLDALNRGREVVG